MRRFKYLLFSGLLICSVNAYAENNYVAADLMFLDMDLTAGNVSMGASPTAVQARVGSFLHKYFGVEGAVALGATDDNFSDESKGELKTLFAINALGRLPLGQSAEVFGRVGMAKMDVKINGGPYNGSHDDTGFLYGIGIGVSFSEYSSISMEYAQLPDVDLPGGGKLETSSIDISYRLMF
ncbi:outer membrane beta-barrel protein [Kaarinaea lacus]